jgi:hypothetical protein
MFGQDVSETYPNTSTICIRGLSTSSTVFFDFSNLRLIGVNDWTTYPVEVCTTYKKVITNIQPSCITVVGLLYVPTRHCELSGAVTTPATPNNTHTL